MKVTGNATLHAPVEAVWAALNDPAILVRAIPGCERLAADGPDSYQLTMTAGVASVRGTYTGRVRLQDQQVPSSFSMKASGAGGPGTVDTVVAVRLADDGDGCTLLSYDADATVGGVIAGVGQRMLSSVAQRMAGEFFDAVDAMLAGPVPAQGASAPQVWDAPRAARRAAPRPAPAGFLPGVLVGAAVALAGVAAGVLIGRRRP